MCKPEAYHRSFDNFCYSPDGKSLVVRLIAGVDNIKTVHLWAGDPHEWEPLTQGKSRWKCHPYEMRRAGCDGVHEYWEVTLVPPYKRLRYFFRIVDLDGQAWDYGEKGLFPCEDPLKASPSGDFWNAFMFPYLHENEVFRGPQWVAHTVWYQIFPERFCNGNPANDPAQVKPWNRGPVTNHEWYGGDLRGIIQKLDHIEKLGCNGIYLTPIFLSPSVHKYDTTDYLTVDPAFGTAEDLRELVQECHRRGIRIMLDAVFNHCGCEFGPWKDVMERGALSPYRDWFYIKEFPLFTEEKDGHHRHRANFETFAFVTGMPKLNTTNPEVREYLLGVAEHYVREFDIDGWRLDVANEIDHAFWQEFRRRVKAIKPDLYIVGEVWHDAMSWLRGDQYDAVMNYPLGMAISDFLLEKNWTKTARDFCQRLDHLWFSYPEPVMKVAFNLLDSHDTDRLVTRMGSREKAKLALTLLFALPGSPCIYYGTEYALEGGGDPDNRRCMIWDARPEEEEFFRFLSLLVQTRRRYWQVFSEGKRTYRTHQAYPGLLAITIEFGSTKLQVLINRDDRPVPADVWKPLAGLAADATFRDLLEHTGLGSAASGHRALEPSKLTGTFVLPGVSAAVLLEE
ncbi:MAG TPA: glycoside hydrolase family 13 protein [Termitinemataceae bacterium]|nr:glycoside hydrolase family 13 protein [Termitinemataceae bacterium]